MSINAEKLFWAYSEMQALHASKPLLDSEFRKIEPAFEAKKTEPDASIMVYGVYNAGKSTLINALMGKEAAAVDDVPTTDSVVSYDWRQFRILDTPGIDAPIEHENVTNSQMLKADAIIFVVNPIGVAEEERTLSTLIELVKEKKQVFLVFNEKDSLSEADYIKLKDQTRQRLQKLALEHGVTSVLKDIPILKVNAKRAFQSRVEQKNHWEKMFESSGFPDFEAELLSFLQGISHDDVYGRLKSKLGDFSEQYIHALKSLSSAEMVRRYAKLLNQVEEQKHRTRKEIGQEISRCRQVIYENSKALLRSSPETSQAAIEELFQKNGQHISSTLESELTVFVHKIQDEIEELQAALPSIILSEQKIAIPEQTVLRGEADNACGTKNSLSASTISPDSVAQIATQIGSLVRPGHIIDALKITKDLLPSLMKGIGPKTMEKLASSIMMKVPYIGPAITIVMSLWDIFSGDSHAKQIERQIDEQNQQRERALQEIDDLSRKLANDFESSVIAVTSPSIDTFFADISVQIDALREGFSNEDRVISEIIEKASAIQQRIIAA
jgi:small GTP-binding protein